MSIPFNAKGNLRLYVVCFAALAASLPMAWVSLSKLLLFTTTLAYLLTWNSQDANKSSQLGLHTTKVLLLIVLAFAGSLLWTEVSLDFALGMLVKHLKLLQILLLVYLVRSVREAHLALKLFVFAQVFILASSWMLAAGIPVPWVFNAQDLATHYVVFSESYLDQSIMLATLAGVVWHLHTEWKWSRYLAAAIAMAALLNVLLLLPGRTGYVACFVVAGLAGLWGLPIRARWALIVGAPLLLALTIAMGSNKISKRFTDVAHEAQNYSQHGATDTSSGWRLNAWRRSIQAIGIKPFIGYGVGSWTPAVKRLDGDKALADFGVGNSSNPHQEFLLWGVELGVVGPLLLVALLLAMALDARQFPTTVKRATQTAVAVTAVACLFNSSLYDALIGDYLCTALGLLLALGTQMRRAQSAGIPLENPRP
jgi:O-antigen ligase